MKAANYLLLLGSLLSALLLAELFIRMFVPEIGWAQRKDAVIGWSSDEYRRFDPTDDAAGGATRILFLGDSYLAGDGVSDLDNRFPVLLQAQLAGKVSTRILAAGGWGTDQQLIAFMQKGIDWKPDLVILAFCANNDTANILSHNDGPKKLKPYFVVKQDQSLELYAGDGHPLNYETMLRTDDARPVKDSQPLRSYLLDYTRAIIRSYAAPDDSDENNSAPSVDPRYKKFRYREEKKEEIYSKQSKLSWSPQHGVNHASAYIHEDFETNTYQWRLFAAILTRLREEVENAGGKLVVMLLPVIFNPEDPATIAGGSFARKFQTPDGYFTFRSVEPRERLQSISARAGVTFIDPTEDFIDRVVDNNLMKQVWPQNNRHFSDLGHEILADLLTDHIEVLIMNDNTTAARGTAPDRNGPATSSDR